MEKKLGKLPVMILTVLAAAIAFVLRVVQLNTAVDSSGRLVSGAGKGPLTWLCLLVLVLSVVYACLAQPRQELKKTQSVGVMAATLVAAFCMALSSVSLWMGERVLGIGGIMTAVCWVIIALLRQQKTVPSAVLFMLPALFDAVRLIVEFRDWSRDPQILDYCFDLLAGICVMCATFHLGAFSFGKGPRKRSLFFCMAGTVFCVIAMAGADLIGVVSMAASALWLMSNLWLLLGEE